MISEVQPQFGESAGDVPQGGQTRDLPFRHEPAAALNLRLLDASENTNSQYRHQRDSEQKNEPFGYGHDLPLTISWEGRVSKSACLMANHSSTRRHPTANSVGPRNTPMKPKVNAPPITPKKIKRKGMLLPWLMSQGLTKLSTLATPKPQTSIKIPQAVEPWLKSH